MKNILFFLFLLPLTIFSQENESDEIGRFSLGISYSPDICYRILDADNNVKWIADLRDSIENPRFGFTTGLKVSFRLNSRISFELGILYADKGEKIFFDENYWNPPSSTPDPNIPNNVKYIYHYNYLDLPIKFNFLLVPMKKGGFFISTAFSPSIFIRQKTKIFVEYNDGRSSESEMFQTGFNKINLSFTLGIGYQHNFNKLFTMKVEPTFRRSINSIIDAPIKSYLYSNGIDLSLFWVF